MDNVILPIDKITKNSLSINEYLILYNISTNNSISGLINFELFDLNSLEKKGFIKLVGNKIHLREKSSLFFEVTDDLFEVWIKTYPTSVKKRHGGQRALSPASSSTMLGKKLKKKWDSIFGKDTIKQKNAIKVLELEVNDKTKSGDLEFMVEATRWLNEGYHEKYSYLLDEDKGENIYKNEDYI